MENPTKMDDLGVRIWLRKPPEILIIEINNNWLVVLTILNNMKVNGKDDPIYEMQNKKCSKPPTRLDFFCSDGQNC